MKQFQSEVTAEAVTYCDNPTALNLFIKNLLGVDNHDLEALTVHANNDNDIAAINECDAINEGLAEMMNGNTNGTEVRYNPLFVPSSEASVVNSFTEDVDNNAYFISGITSQDEPKNDTLVIRYTANMFLLGNEVVKIESKVAAKDFKIYSYPEYIGHFAKFDTLYTVN